MCTNKPVLWLYFVCYSAVGPVIISIATTLASFELTLGMFCQLIGFLNYTVGHKKVPLFKR